MPIGLKKWKRLRHLLRQSEIPQTLPPELADLHDHATVVVWFDSGRDKKPNRAQRYTTTWAYQPLGGIRLNKDTFLMHMSGGGGFLRNLVDPHLTRPDKSEVRAFESKLPDTASFETVPEYVTDLIAAWFALAGLRLSDYSGRVDMATDGQNAVRVMSGVSTPRYTLSGRNLGSELKSSLDQLSLGLATWHFVPESRTRFLNARQKHSKIVVSGMTE